MQSHTYQSWCRITGISLLLGMGAGLAGCVSPWWNGFLTPHEMGNFRENRVSEIQRSISFRDKPAGIAGTVDPTPEDLVATVEEYRLGAGDALSVRMLDFIQLGMETELTPIIDELGYIDVPQLGWLHVEGMTPRELQNMLVQRSKEAGIFPEDSNPTITVQPLSKQQRTYNIDGTVASPGQYSIVRPDFRLREAINQAGGLSDSVRTIYVFRNEPREQLMAPKPAQPAANESQPAPDQPAPPVTPLNLSEMGGEGTKVAAETASSTPALALPTDAVQRDLVNAVAPATIPSPETEAGAKGSGRMPTYIFVNNQFIEAPQQPGETVPSEPATTPATTSTPRTGPTSPQPANEPVNWEELASEGDQRVLRIPAEKLKNGDPTYNIVIKHQDWIKMDPGAVGVFYLGGHVLRPGSYSLTGNEMTLTQAIVAAGGLDQLAWPTRCEVRRRLDGDREETTQWDLSRIMDGRDPDLFLKKDDLIRIGTHPIAPLLATIRNSFRLTYGFGFVYDRNFADIDSVQGQNNPNDRRQLERAALGL